MNAWMSRLAVAIFVGRTYVKNWRNLGIYRGVKNTVS
jgi:hypothetical protein